jgi:hypothetical protein
MKKIFQRFGSSYRCELRVAQRVTPSNSTISEQSNRIVEQLSEAKDALNKFSSANHIAGKHEAQSLEAGHEFIRPARYINSVTGKSSLAVVYGLELEHVRFMETLRGGIESLPVRILAMGNR